MTTRLCLLFALLWVSAQAFKPNTAGHVGVTDEALVRLEFCPQARDAVENANVLTDIFEQLVSEAHFDDESLQAGSERLLNKKSQILELMDRAVEDADDFDLTDSIFDLFPDLQLDFFQVVRQALGSDLSNRILGTSDAQSAAWTTLGEALHSLQDFYSHSNWLEMGNANRINPDLGRVRLNPPPAGSAPCPNDPAVLDLNGDGMILTTGYFDFRPSQHCALEEAPGKCRHGWDLAGCASGLNKDEASRPGYTEARALAVEATVQFVSDILDELSERSARHVELFRGGTNCNSLRNDTLVFRRHATLQSDCETFSFEVDQVGDDYRLEIFLDNGMDSVTVRDPSGREVVDSSAVTVDDDDDEAVSYDWNVIPAAGTYEMEICADRGDDYTVELLSYSRVIPFDLFFVRPAGVRNEGEFPHSENQQPIRGRNNELYAEILGDVDVSSLRFFFSSLDGNTDFEEFTMDTTENTSDRTSFTTFVSINTAEPFQVRMEGRIDGDRFTRVFRTKTFQAQYPEIQYISNFTTFQVGPDARELTFAYRVTNYGPTERTYQLSATVEGLGSNSVDGTITTQVDGGAKSVSGQKSIPSRNLILRPDQGAVVYVEMEVVDDDLDVGDLLQLTLTAQASGESQRNAVDVIGQYVGCGGSPICGGRGTCTTNSDQCQCYSPDASGSLCLIGGDEDDDDDNDDDNGNDDGNDDDDGVTVTVGFPDDDDSSTATRYFLSSMLVLALLAIM